METSKYIREFSQRMVWQRAICIHVHGERKRERAVHTVHLNGVPVVFFFKKSIFCCFLIVDYRLYFGWSLFMRSPTLTSPALNSLICISKSMQPHRLFRRHRNSLRFTYYIKLIRPVCMCVCAVRMCSCGIHDCADEPSRCRTSCFWICFWIKAKLLLL